MLEPRARHPVVVAPGVRRLEDHRRRGGRDLGVERHRVGLLAPLPVGAEDRELVAGAAADVGHEQLPHAGLAELAHRVLAAVPAVERALHPHAACGRRPDRERGAGDGAAEGRVVAVHPGAEDLPQVLVPSLVDQVQVDLAERRQEPVRVVQDDRAGVVADLDPVVRDLLGVGDDAGPDALELVLEPGRGVAVRHHDAGGERLEHPDGHPALVRVRSEDGVRLAVLAADRAARARGGRPA